MDEWYALLGLKLVGAEEVQPSTRDKGKIVTPAPASTAGPVAPSPKSSEKSSPDPPPGAFPPPVEGKTTLAVKGCTFDQYGFDVKAGYQAAVTPGDISIFVISSRPRRGPTVEVAKVRVTGKLNFVASDVPNIKRVAGSAYFYEGRHDFSDEVGDVFYALVK